MMHNNFSGEPHLVMVIEPETKIRFRYKSEGGSHGGLLGKQKGKGKKIYPTVKLEGYDKNKSVYIRVSLYTENKEPHIFEFVGQSEEGTPYITEYLKDDYTATFTNLKFLSKKKDEICSLLMDRKIRKLKGNIAKCVRERFEKQYDKELKEKAKNIMDSVRLCFEAFEDDNPDVSICEPLFSDVICNQKAAAKGKLLIHRMSSIAGSWKGGDEVILLCDKVQKDNIEIHFYEEDCGKKIWKENAIFTPADVHYQVAIYFKTPQYKVNAEKTVFVCLARNGEYSKPLEFTYKAEFDEKPSKKRKNCVLQEPVIISSPECSANSSCNETSDTPPETGEDTVLLNLDMEDLLNQFVGMGGLEEIFSDIALPSDDYMDGCIVNAQMGYNQNLTLFSTHTDNVDVDGGGRLVGQMGMGDVLSVKRGTVNDSVLSSSLKQKSENKCKTNKHSKRYFCEVSEEIQHKMHSQLLKRDDSGNTFLHVAVHQNRNVASILQISYFANADIINVNNYYQETALHIAVQQNNSELVKILLRNGGNPNLKNAEGSNCYHIASQDNYTEVMHCLLTYVRGERELNAFNYEGITPLHMTVMKNSVECYHLLKSHYADLSSLDKKAGRSLLHYAVEFQPLFVAILLDEGKIDVNIQDFEGNTPLHIACACQNIEVVEQLLKAGADPFLKNFKQNCNTLEEEKSDDDSDGEPSAKVTPDLDEMSDDVDGQVPADVTTNLEVLKVLMQASANMLKSKEKIDKLCSLLDVDMRWKLVAIYVMDEQFINSLECSPSPAKTLLQEIQKEKQDGYIEHLKSVLEITGPSEAVEFIKENF